MTTRETTQPSGTGPQVTTTRETAQPSWTGPQVTTTRETAQPSWTGPQVTTTRETAQPSGTGPQVTTTREIAQPSRTGPQEPTTRETAQPSGTGSQITTTRETTQPSWTGSQVTTTREIAQPSRTGSQVTTTRENTQTSVTGPQVTTTREIAQPSRTGPQEPTTREATQPSRIGHQVTTTRETTQTLVTGPQVTTTRGNTQTSVTGPQVTYDIGTDEQRDTHCCKGNITSIIIQATTWLVIGCVLLCLIVAYATDLDGEVSFQDEAHTPCELEVDAASARRISNLIHNDEIKLFYLDLKFPDGVILKHTSNIFQKKSMVWTFGGYPGTKHLLDLPWMYFVWSFSLLDHYTYRNVDLTLRTKGNNNCPLVLGTRETTFAIVNALRDLTINITKENNQINKNVLKSVWCQAYFKEHITTSLEEFSKFFRFYYSDVRYKCSHIDQNAFDVVLEESFRSFPRQWSDLAFTLSIIVLWFFPSPFLYSENTVHDSENIYFGHSITLAFRTVLGSLFQDCFKPKCCSVGLFGCFLLIFVVCPLGVYITYIIIKAVPEVQTIFSDLENRGHTHPWDISGFFNSNTGLFLFLYLITFFVFFVCTICMKYLNSKCCENERIMFATPNTEQTNYYKKIQGWFWIIPWLYVGWKISTIYDRRNKVIFLLNIFLIVVLYPFLLFGFQLILFKSLMFFFMFFAFGILSVITFTKLISDIFIYISAGILFFLNCMLYPGKQYHKFMALIIDVMKTNEKLKGTYRIDSKGDYGINKTLFIKLVKEHMPLSKMILKLLFELYFVIAVFAWIVVWIRDLNQWSEIATIKNIILSGIIYKFPSLIEFFFFAQDDNIVKRRLKKSITNFYAGLIFNGINQACGGITRAYEGLKEAQEAEQNPSKKEIGVKTACAGIVQSREAIEEISKAIESLEEIGQCHVRTEIEQIQRVIKQAHAAVEQCLVETKRYPIREARSKLEYAGEAIKHYVCNEIKQAREIIEEACEALDENQHKQACNKIKQSLGEIEQCHVRIEIEQSRQSIEKTRGAIDLPQIDPTLQNAIDGLRHALDGLGHSIDGLEQVHGNTDSQNKSDGTGQDAGRKIALDGLNIASYGIIEARNAIEADFEEYIQ